MIWNSLAALQIATSIEFTPSLAQKHCFVQLPSGAWIRTLGPPSDRDCLPGRRVRFIRGRVYHIEAVS
jgi:hypothetical protein